MQSFWAAFTSSDKQAPKPLSPNLLRLISELDQNTDPKLILARKGIDDEAIEGLEPTLQKKTSVTAIDLSGNQIGGTGTRRVAEWVKTCLALTDLNLSGNRIGTQGGRFLAQALLTHRTLRNLNLWFASLGDDGVRELAAALPNHTSLKVLNVGNNNIGPNGTESLFKGLLNNYSLTTLIFSHSTMSEQAAGVLAQVLGAKLSQLATLDIGFNEITPTAAIKIFEALSQNSTLTSFNISNNSMGDKVVDALVAALQKNHTLRMLNVETSKFSLVGIQKICGALKIQRTLRWLNISNIPFGDVGAPKLIEMLQTNFTLIDLGINKCEINETNQQSVNDLIKRNRDLAKELYDACESETFDKVESLLKQGVSPCTLYAKANQKTNGDTALHVAARKRNKKLIELLLNDEFKHRSALLEMKNKEGQTPLDIVKTQEDNAEFMPLLDPARMTTTLAATPTPPPSSSSSAAVPLADRTLNDRAEIVVSLLIADEELKEIKMLSDRGGFGAVFLGMRGREEVAIKKIRAMLSETALAAFKREASMMAGLNSKYIVRIMGVCLTPPLRIVMELMEGSLYDVIHMHKKKLSLQAQQQLAKGIIFGIEFLESKKIIHRDIKSLNVLVDKNMQPKLGDFGMADAREEVSTRARDQPQSEQLQEAGGTLLWKAPELFKGKMPTSKSDVYSFGVVLWEILTGQLPFKHAGGNRDLIVEFIKQGPYDYDAEATAPLLLHTPNYFQKVMKGCWEKEPDKRLTVDKVIEMLETGEKELENLRSGFMQSGEPVAPVFGEKREQP